MAFDVQYQLELHTSQYADKLFRLIDKNRDRISQHFPKTNAKTGSLEETQKYSNEIEGLSSEKTYFMYLIMNSKSNEPLGFIDIKNIDWEKRKAELGAFIDADFENFGIMAHFSKVLIRQIVNELGFKALFCRIDPNNTRSIRLAERNGFTLKSPTNEVRSDNGLTLKHYEREFTT